MPVVAADTMHSPDPGREPRLILDLQVTPRPGIWPQVITPVSVRYDQVPAKVMYQSVLVREPDGDAVQIDVDEVQ